MNKARVAEAARGFIPNKDNAAAFVAQATLACRAVDPGTFYTAEELLYRISQRSSTK
jgi:hypothetical protein